MNWSLILSHNWFQLIGPLWIILIILCAYLYRKYIVHSHVYDVTKSQKAYFTFAMIIGYILHGSPFSIIASDYLFSAHVVQLAGTLFIITPLLVLSLPVILLRNFFWNYKLKLSMQLLAHPWLTAVLFNGLLTAYFIPTIFNTLKMYPLLLAIAKLTLFVHAFLMWWVIINPLPNVTYTSPITRVVYIFFASALLMPIGVFLLIILKAHYPFYQAVAGEFAPVLTIVYDQQLGGGLLKIIQILSYSYALLKIVMHWGKMEEKEEGKVDDENIRVVQGVVIDIRNHKK